MAEMHPIRVMIVDDHNMVRRGLVAYLEDEPDLEPVGQAADGTEAVQICEQAQPDVILMDLVLPELSGVEATRIIRHRWPQVQVIALTSFQERELVQDALRAGAISYLLKNVSGSDLVEAIRAAHARRSTLAPEAIDALIQSTGPEPTPGPALTPRERDVLTLLVKGLTNAEIAARLGVSRSTVKVHVSNILSKLGVSSRGEATTVAMQSNLLREAGGRT
jgi:NarL family two-component system response regulator LiaR